MVFTILRLYIWNTLLTRFSVLNFVPFLYILSLIGELDDSLKPLSFFNGLNVWSWGSSNKLESEDESGWSSSTWYFRWCVSSSSYTWSVMKCGFLLEFLNSSRMCLTSSSRLSKDSEIDDSDSFVLKSFKIQLSTYFGLKIKNFWTVFDFFSLFMLSVEDKNYK